MYYYITICVCSTGYEVNILTLNKKHLECIISKMQAHTSATIRDNHQISTPQKLNTSYRPEILTSLPSAKCGLSDLWCFTASTNNFLGCLKPTSRIRVSVGMDTKTKKNMLKPYITWQTTNCAIFELCIYSLSHCGEPNFNHQHVRSFQHEAHNSLLSPTLNDVQPEATRGCKGTTLTVWLICIYIYIQIYCYKCNICTLYLFIYTVVSYVIV